MNSDYLTNNKHFVPAVLLGVSAVFAVLSLVKVAGFFATSARAQSIVAKAVDQDKTDPNLLEKKLAAFREIADVLKKKNLFVPPVPRRHPVSSVLGIMGSEALINGKWYKVGDEISGAEIVAIEATLVKIKWDGKEKSFAPISAIVADASGPPAKVEKTPKDKKEKPKKPAAKSKRVKAEVSVSSGADDPLAWMGVKLSAKLRSKLLKMWSNASDEDKRRGMADWKKASEEEKQQMLSMLEAMPEGEMGG